MARAVVGDPDAAEDVCQDALFRIWRRLGECRDAERFGAWLASAVRRLALNSLRGTRPTSALGDAPSRGPLPDRLVEDAELRDRLDNAMARLGEEQRHAVLLFDQEGWSHARIAELLGTTEAMSRQHLMLGRRRLRQLLAHEEDRT